MVPHTAHLKALASRPFRKTFVTPATPAHHQSRACRQQRNACLAIEIHCRYAGKIIDSLMGLQ